jgi:protein-L-isoaspartate(D-aspartate) O-methyltransferase
VHYEQRRLLVDALLRSGALHSTRIADAFLAVPRELFVTGVPLEDVYRSDAAIAIKAVNGVTLSSASAPDVMAAMLEQLDVRPGQRVLEIGAGTGYNAALLARLVGPRGYVVTIDVDADIVAAAREHLGVLGTSNVEVVLQDGAYGFAPHAPYDRIMLTAASPDIAPAWREQLLTPGGRLLLPLSFGGVQRCVAFEPRGEQLESMSVGGCGFIALRGLLGAGTAAPLHVVLRLADPESGALPLRETELQRLNASGGRIWRSGVVIRQGDAVHGLQLWLAAHEPWLSSIGSAWSDRSGPVGEVCLVGALSAADLAERLLEHTRAWDEAGRPAMESLRLSALPAGVPYTPSSGEIVFDRQWTRFVVRWSAPADR